MYKRQITEEGSASAFSEPVSYQYDMIKPVITESGVNNLGKPSFTWENVEDAEKYEIFRSDSENGEYEKLATLVETSYADPTAEIGKVYYYKISAVAGEAFAMSDAVAIQCQEPVKAEVDRVDGANRYETAVASADKLKDVYGVDKFDNIIVAYGDDYADALAGSYLAKAKKAPILLVNNAAEGYVKSYIDNNLNAGGTVYILGGEGVVSKTCLLYTSPSPRD